jgi:hypothetical protein
MTFRLGIIGLLAAGVGFGQLQLFRIDAPGSEQPVGAQFDVGKAVAGDLLDTRLRIRNLAEETAITLTRFRVRGVGFTLENHPSIPYIMAPKTNVDFRVRFRPPGHGSYSATLEINDLSVLFMGESPAAVTISIEEQGAFRALQTDEPVVFGRIERTKSLARRFRLENPGTTSLTVSTLTIAKSAFDGSNLPLTPLTLKPGGSTDFTITYQPQSSGIHRSTLQIDQRQFVLEAVAFDLPFPVPQILLETQALRSGQQSKLSVRLASPSFSSGTGELRIEFQPSMEAGGDDPAIQFLASGNRTLPVKVSESQTAVQLGSESEAMFQTGTTAGTITFVVTLGAHVVRASAAVAPAAVVIDSAAGRRTGAGVEVQLKGYDNSRSTSEAAFTFFDNQGRMLTGQPIRAQVAAAFRDYFKTSQVGGMFSLVAAFPVTGDATRIGSVEVELTNSAGASEKRRASF